MEKQTEKRVEVFIPRGYAADDPNYFVGLNGVSYLLPKGKRVMVPEAVAEEIRRAERAQRAWEARSAQLAESASD